jgi:FtsH-binding integral membrane protein
MTGARFLITGISAATGACFAALAGLSLSAMVLPVRRFHVFSIVIAVVAICLGYLAFRAATAGKTDEETVLGSLRRGLIGAFVGLIVIMAFLLMFRSATHAFLAHALGKPASIFTDFRLLLASVLLGFGTGFVVRMPTAPASPEERA